MSHLSYRNLAMALVASGASLTLAACGSPAVNTNYTPGANPTTGVSVGATPSGRPTSGSTKSGGTPTGHATTGTHTTAKAGSTPSRPSLPSGGHSTPSGSGGHTVAPSSAVITVTPNTNLASGQTVTIHGSHFKPSIKVIVVQCIDKGSSTQANNCNINILALPKGFYPAANGTFTVTLRVQRTFGSNTCSTATPCLVSVTEPNNNPTEEADAPIRFR